MKLFLFCFYNIISSRYLKIDIDQFPPMRSATIMAMILKGRISIFTFTYRYIFLYVVVYDTLLVYY